MMDLAHQVAVERVLSQQSAGVIFAGRKPCGAYVRVLVTEPLWPVPGEVYAVHGAEKPWQDQYGRRWPQVEATRIERMRTSGALIRPWLEHLPHVGPKRAERLMAAFGENLLDVLQDDTKHPDLAAALEPDRPWFAQRLVSRIASDLAIHLAHESSHLAQARFYAKLEALGVTDRFAARRLWRLIGSSTAEDRLVANPYLAANILPWKQADALGLRLLAVRGVADPRNAPERLSGALDSAWRSVLSSGDTATVELHPNLTRELH